jgi:hypothetical protein
MHFCFIFLLYFKTKEDDKSLNTTLNRKEQTALSRFRTRHLKSMKILDGTKVCTQRIAKESTPTHIFQYIGVNKKIIQDDKQKLISELKKYNSMELFKIKG